MNQNSEAHLKILETTDGSDESNEFWEVGFISLTEELSTMTFTNLIEITASLNDCLSEYFKNNSKHQLHKTLLLIHNLLLNGDEKVAIEFNTSLLNKIKSVKSEDNKTNELIKKIINLLQHPTILEQERINQFGIFQINNQISDDDYYYNDNINNNNNNNNNASALVLAESEYDLDTIISMSEIEYENKVELNLKEILIETNIDLLLIDEIIRILMFAKNVNVLDIIKSDITISNVDLEKIKHEIKTNQFLDKYFREQAEINSMVQEPLMSNQLRQSEIKSVLIEDEHVVPINRPLKQKELNVIIDGSNVATIEIQLSPQIKIFSPRRIELVVDALKKIAKNINLNLVIIVILPAHRKFEDTTHRIKTIDYQILRKLIEMDIVLFTPSRHHDDPYILEMAKDCNGLILANDKFSKISFQINKIKKINNYFYILRR